MSVPVSSIHGGRGRIWFPNCNENGRGGRDGI